MAGRNRELDLSNEVPTDRAELLLDVQRAQVNLRWLGLRMEIDGEGPAGSPVHTAIAVIYLTLASVLPGAVLALISAFTTISGVLVVGLATALFIVVFVAGMILTIVQAGRREVPPPVHTLNGHRAKSIKPKSKVKRR